MVDLDIGTENLRWMGDTRFVLGFLKGVVSNRNYKARIRMDVVESDKIEMARMARERSHVATTSVGKGHDPLDRDKGKDGRPNLGGPSSAQTENNHTNGHASNSPTQDAKQHEEKESRHEDGADESGIPEAKPLEPTDKWLTIDSGSSSTEAVTADGAPNSILYFYAGTMPWVSRDLNQWPVATLGEGAINVVVQRLVSPPEPKQIHLKTDIDVRVGKQVDNGQCN